MQRDSTSDNPRSQDNDLQLTREEIEALDARIDTVAEHYPDLLEKYIPLADLTTFRIGGPALGLCRIRNIDEALRFQEISRREGIPTVSLGGGSNILADDRGFAGIVARMEYSDISFNGEVVKVGAGMGFDDLIGRTLEAGLCGLEFASGIPGSIGGAVVGNAGCFGHEIGEFLIEALVLETEGQLKTVGPEDLHFSYRHSGLSGSDTLLLEATFKLKHGNLQTAQTCREENLALRRAKHPVDQPTAGSYFKNLPPLESGGRRQAAGQLLEEAGAIGLRVGDAAVFEKHANIIVNKGRAGSADVLDLALEMKRRVLEKFGIELEAEVRHLKWLGGD